VKASIELPRGELSVEALKKLVDFCEEFGVEVNIVAEIQPAGSLGLLVCLEPLESSVWHWGYQGARSIDRSNTATPTTQGDGPHQQENQNE
jgi:hypothetical protein